VQNLKEEKNTPSIRSSKFFLTIPNLDDKDIDSALNQGEPSYRLLLSKLSEREGDLLRGISWSYEGHYGNGNTPSVLVKTPSEKEESPSILGEMPSENSSEFLESTSLPYQNKHHIHLYLEYTKQVRLKNNHFDYLGKHGHLVPVSERKTTPQYQYEARLNTFSQYVQQRKVLSLVSYLGKETKLVYTNLQYTHYQKKILSLKEGITLKEIISGKKKEKEYLSKKNKRMGMYAVEEAHLDLIKDELSLFLSNQLASKNLFNLFFRNTDLTSSKTNFLKIIDRDPIFSIIAREYHVAGKSAYLEESLKKGRELRSFFQVSTNPLNDVKRMHLEGEKGEALVKKQGYELFKEITEIYKNLFEIVTKLFRYRKIRERKKESIEGSSSRVERKNNYMIYSEKNMVGKTSFVKFLAGFFSTYSMPQSTSNLANWENWRDDLVKWEEPDFEYFTIGYLACFLQNDETKVGSVKVYKKDFPIMVCLSNDSLRETLKKKYDSRNRKDLEKSYRKIETRMKEINLGLTVQKYVLELFPLIFFLQKIFYLTLIEGFKTNRLSVSKSTILKMMEEDFDYYLELGDSETSEEKLKREYLEKLMNLLENKKQKTLEEKTRIVEEILKRNSDKSLDQIWEETCFLKRDLLKIFKILNIKEI